jgi:hypothetical protein
MQNNLDPNPDIIEFTVSLCTIPHNWKAKLLPDSAIFDEGHGKDVIYFKKMKFNL